MSIVFPRNAYRTCPVCVFYASRRATVLEPEFALRAFKRGVAVSVVQHEYLTGVHARHLAGHSLSTRLSIPGWPKRRCNGCLAVLGNLTEDELEERAYDRPEPDVRLECGCQIGEAA